VFFWGGERFSGEETWRKSDLNVERQVFFEGRKDFFEVWKEGNIGKESLRWDPRFLSG
jgi:hypothetical protein